MQCNFSICQNVTVMLSVHIKNKIPELLTHFPTINLLKKNPVSSSDEVIPVEVSYQIFDTFAPPLMVMHGLLGSKSNWQSKCKLYSEKTVPPRQIISIDSRNHGYSPHTDIHTYHHIVTDMKALFDRMYLKKVALMGHSMGGRSCMLFSLKYPNLVDKLIVADISPITGLHMAEFAKIFYILLAAEIPSGVPVSKAVQIMDVNLKPKIASNRLRSFLLSNITRKKDGSIGWRSNLNVLAKDLKHLCIFPLEDTMKYEGPTLFVAGRNSNFVPESDLPKILKYFPKAELVYIKGATHLLHLDKPQEYMDITLEFLNRKD